MANNVLLVKEFNLDAISYGQIKTLDSGARVLSMNYENNRTLIQLPWMPIPYSINDMAYDGTPAKSFKLPMSMRGWDGPDPKIKALYEKLIAFENKVVRDGVTNCLTWFKKKAMSEETVREIFSSAIKHDINKETLEITNRYPPIFSPKLPYDPATGVFNFTALDMTEQTVDFLDIKPNLKGGRVRPIVQPSGMWFAGGAFGVSWRISQAQFDPSYQSTGAVKFRKDDDDDDVVGGRGDDDDLAADAAEAVRAAPKKAAVVAPVAAKAVAKAAPVAAKAAPPVKAAAPPPAAAPPVDDDEAEVEAEAPDEETEDAEGEDAEAEEGEAEAEEEEAPPPPPPPPPPPAAKKVIKKNAPKA